MNDQLFVIDGVQNLSNEEVQNVDGGMFLSSCGAWWKCALKIGGGLAGGWYLAKSVET